MNRDDSPADVTIRSESISIVKDAIGKLPYDLRAAVLRYEYEGLSDDEISAVLRCCVKAVEMKLYRAGKAASRKPVAKQSSVTGSAPLMCLPFFMLCRSLLLLSHALS